MAGSNGCLIPGLPDDISLQCLVRIPRFYHPVLRCVNCVWKNLLDSPLFHSQRAQLGFTNTSLLMLPKYHNNTQKIQCWELDVESHKIFKPVFYNSRATFYKFHACAALGRLIMLFGDFDFQCNVVYVFDIFNKKWRAGPCMRTYWRYEFAWGVIDGRLYITGGHLGNPSKYIVESEVYDPQSDSWSSIASLPDAIVIESFFVLKGSLFVMGSHKSFSYDPGKDQWQPEPWLVELCDTAPMGNPDSGSHHMVTTDEENCIYFLEDDFKESGRDLNVFKYSMSDLHWKRLLSIQNKWSLCEECDSRYGGYEGYEGKFYGLKDKVLVMEHLEDEPNGDENEAYDVKVTEEAEVIRVALLCPYDWFTTIVDA